MMNSQHSSPTLPYLFNLLGLLGICIILAIAFYYQLALKELPCPLCLLQRSAFIAIGLGFMLNLRFKIHTLHYGAIIISALLGLFPSVRQIALHLIPPDTGYGSILLSLHFYTLAALAFLGFILWTALALCFYSCQKSSLLTGFKKISAPLTIALMILFSLLVLGNGLSTLLECGLGPCADNPIAYQLLG